MISWPRNTVFWRIVAVLVGAELLVVALTIGLTARFAAERTRELAATSIESRLDAVAEEVERRAAPLTETLDLSPTLKSDLVDRFPDPVALVRVDGRIITLHAAQAGDTGREAVSPIRRPPLLDSLNAFDALVVDISSDALPGGYAFAPLFDATGLAVGGLLVQPLTASLNRELLATREAAQSSVRVVAVVAIVLALVLGGLITWWVVAPLRRISARVVEIGAGKYDARVDAPGHHEIGKLAEAVNHMAADVERSVSRLQEADTLRRELLANMGHDIRTPLAGAMAYIEEAERFTHEGRPTEAAVALGSAMQAAQRVRRLIDDLFELSILEGEASVLRREPVLVHELLGDVMGAMRALAPSGVSLDLDEEAATLVVEGDGLRLHRLFSNLVSNALRHARTRVSIRTDRMPGRAGADGKEASEDSIAVVVEDDGRGLSPGEVARVFERYYRGTDARTKRPDPEAGTGLGLAIVRAVAEAHGGSVRMQSTPGQGTRVTVELPLTRL